MESNGANKHYILTAKEAVALLPLRYRLPPPAALRMLRSGHIVKLLVAPKDGKVKPEEVWATVTHRHVKNFIGMVCDALGRTQYHGLSKGAPVQFKSTHIVDILFERPKAAPKGVKII